MVWRSGVHIAGTSIWCDARRARDLCFVSRADRVTGARHGQLIATAETLALVPRKGKGDDESQLAVPPGRPFTLGTVRLELFRSGSAIGGASLAVDTGARRVVYAGAVGPRGGGLGGGAEQRPCDVLVVSAHHGDPRIVLPPPEVAVEEIAALAAPVCGGGGDLVLLVAGPLDGLELAAALDRAGLAARHRLAAHRSIHHLARRLAAAGLGEVPLRRVGARPQPGQVLLWPAARRGDLDRAPPPPGSALVLVSGDAVLPDAAPRARADRAVPWSLEADHPALVRYIEESGASSIYLTGRHAARMAAELGGGGRAARALGPPEQMSLFP
ncbi:MAG TPA: hypothetical protein VKZ63_07410 [Kofleriaceae bacterium]|nr:hypothetical protein [Kofleriaceae bacterium]